MPIEIGSVVEGKVSGITSFGAFISLPENAVGLVHISEIAYEYVKSINDHISVGDIVKVKVLGINKQGKYDLSLKKAAPQPEGVAPSPQRAHFHNRRERHEEKKLDPFEEKITAFLKQSEEKLLDHKRNLQRKQEGKKKTVNKG